jgi:IclR family acetate operon transcriptional repressor
LSRNGPPPRSLISRVAAILSTFSAGSSHSVTEIAHLTGLPVSTAHRLTGELVSWQLLNRTTEGRYEVGLALQRLHGDVSSMSALYERAPHMVTDLCEVTQRRARLGILRGGRVAYIEKRVGPRPATRFCPDAVLPAHATALGKALLAFSPRETVASVEQKLAAYTECTLTSPDQLRRALHFVRRARRAVSRGELFPGDTAVAVPVFGPGGVVAAALELEVPDMRADGKTCTAALVVAARGLSRELAVDARAGRPRLRVVPDQGEACPTPPSAAVLVRAPAIGTSTVPESGARPVCDGACQRLKGGSRVPQEA